MHAKKLSEKVLTDHAHRQIIAPAARLPPPVFTGAAPLPLGGSPAGLPTQLIRLWQGTQHYVS